MDRMWGQGAGLQQPRPASLAQPVVDPYHPGIRLASEVVLTAPWEVSADIRSGPVNAAIEADSIQLNGRCWTSDIEHLNRYRTGMYAGPVAAHIDARMDVKDMSWATRLRSGQDRDEPLL